MYDPDSKYECDKQEQAEYLDREYEWACDKVQMKVYQYFSCRTRECFRTIRDLLQDAYDDQTFNWKCFVDKLNLTDLDIYALFEFERDWKERFLDNKLEEASDNEYHRRYG